MQFDQPACCRQQCRLSFRVSVFFTDSVYLHTLLPIKYLSVASWMEASLTLSMKVSPSLHLSASEPQAFYLESLRCPTCLSFAYQQGVLSFPKHESFSSRFSSRTCSTRPANCLSPRFLQIHLLQLRLLH